MNSIKKTPKIAQRKAKLNAILVINPGVHLEVGRILGFRTAMSKTMIFGNKVL